MSSEVKNNCLISTLPEGIQQHEVRLFVPKRFNNGKIIPVREITEIENKIIESVGAFTKYPCTGVWKDGSKIYVDINSEYKMETAKNGITDLKNIAEYVKKVCEQKAIHISVFPNIVLDI